MYQTSCIILYTKLCTYFKLYTAEVSSEAATNPESQLIEPLLNFERFH